MCNDCYCGKIGNYVNDEFVLMDLSLGSSLYLFTANQTDLKTIFVISVLILSQSWCTVIRLSQVCALSCEAAL